MGAAQVLDRIPHVTLVLPVTLMLIAAAIKLICQYFSPQARRLRSLPVVQAKDDIELRKSIQQAYNKYSKNGEFYRLNDKSHPMVIMPPKYMSEVKALPESELSFKEEIWQRQDGELSGIGRFEPSFIKTITGDLTKRLPLIMDELAEETDYAFNGIIGDAQTSVTMLPAAQRIIALLSSRVFVGPELCHNEKWLDAVVTYTNNAFHTSDKVWQYPAKLRKHIAPHMKAFQKMRADRTEVERMLAPLISARQKAAFSADSDDEFDDILTRLIKNAPADKKDDVSYHAINQLQMGAAGIHTTAQMLTQSIFNLAANPDVIDELRQELQEVLQHTSEAKTLLLTKPGLAKLIKLDSLMKETQRTTPLGIVAVMRHVNNPAGHTMSNGLHLPFGTYTAVNTYNITQDPDIYPEPEKFDAFRFSKLHAKGGVNATKYQFTTVNPEFAAFGQGTHSCPGRFFAMTEIKVALAYILLNYHVSFEYGQVRPANDTRGTLQSPNARAKIVFTPRADRWSLTGESD